MKFQAKKRQKMSDFLLSSYEYDLPRELIANEPVMPRSSARLMVFHRDSGEVEHLHFGDLARVLPQCDVIFNDTKVIKARIFGHKTSGGKSEIMLNQPLGEGKFSAYIRGRVSAGDKIVLGEQICAVVDEICADGLRNIHFERGKFDTNLSTPLSTDEVFALCEKIGHVPLPPYIKREDTDNDALWYQTIFAKHAGAVAAPTASLHFDDELLGQISTRHKTHYITLHVGAGTFKPVESADIRAHKMHSEYYSIAGSALDAVQSERDILAVGTTVARTIEHFARTGATSGMCDLFLHPHNPPRRVTYLLTNFHLPASTLIMLVSAFIGRERTLELYKLAVSERYRFFSYGDGMLIL